MEYTIANIAPIFLLPFFAFVINAFLRKKEDWISTAAIFGSAVYSFRVFKDFVFGQYSADYYVHKVFNWIDLSAVGNTFKIDMGIYIDNMTAVMLLMVSVVAFFIHLFSTWYMKGDIRYGRFFTYLSLFTSAMLGLVLSDNLLSVFIFWEIMGFCSYSLIGFYFEKEKAGYASIKAFMTTRVGDVIFLLGILAIWSVVGNVNFPDIYAAVSQGSFEGISVLGIGITTFAAFCIFCGTIGKSAQFPLQVWLPDAMMGPTPCSALIHAATMVAAGVYLSLRCYPLMEAGGLTPFIAIIGGITAFGAATIALVQTDLKAVLAFSTISQLGYMVLGVGVGSYNAAFMHLITHAIFKACLFLSAGSVIHSVHTQEMPQMGGLRKKLPFTFIAMLFCTFAITGVPFFSGFVSKDRILGDALYWAVYGMEGAWYAYLAPLLGFAGALLTAFYMFRMMFLTFFGEPRDKEVYDHCHKEHFSFNANFPLLFLALFTFGFWFSGAAAGSWGHFFPKGSHEWFQVLIEAPQVVKFEGRERQQFSNVDIKSDMNLEMAEYTHQPTYVGPNMNTKEDEHHLHTIHLIGAIGSIIIAFLGIFMAYLMYIKKSIDPAKWVATFPKWTRALKNKYYFDELYIDNLIEKGLLGFNRVLAFIDMGLYDRFAIDGWKTVNEVMYKTSNWFDRVIVDKIAVDGNGFTVNLFNFILRGVQNGRVQFYFIVLIFVLFSYVWSLSL